MRIAFIGIRHWHAKHYYLTVAKLSQHQIVGVSDPDTAVLNKVGVELGVATYTDYRDLLEAQRPNFVFIFAPHAELAGIAADVIEQGVPCLIEKPGGINSQQISALRQNASIKNLHVGTGFNFRVSDFYHQVITLIEDDEVTWSSFRFIAGFPSRYLETKNDWMLDPAKSGGGCTINLSIHFFDLFCEFTRSLPTEVSALMGHHSWGLDVEDYSSVALRSEQALCTVETGYTFPSSAQRVFDILFAVRTRTHYLKANSNGVIEIYRNSDSSLKEVITPSIGNSYWYPQFVEQTLSRFERGLPPIADLHSLERAMQLVDSAYVCARNNARLHIPSHST